MTKATLAFAMIVSTANLAVAQQQQQVEGNWVVTRFFRVHLRNGNCVDGDLVKRTDREVVLRLGAGEISFRSDQINKVEYVKMKSYNEASVFLPKKTPQPKAPESAGKPAVPPSDRTPDLADSDAPIPASISLDTANKVDQTIVTWKQANETERLDLSAALISMGPDIAPYLEFLLEKRARSTPLEPVAMALVALAEDRFLELYPKLMGGLNGQLRQAAVAGLAKATSSRRIPLLVEAMNDSDPTVWRTATDAVLSSTSNEADRRDLADQIASRIRTSKNNLGLAIALGRLGGPAAHAALWDLVNDSNETNRLIGLHGVGTLANPDDGPKVVGLLRERSETLKKQVCQTIGRMKYEKAAGDLVQLLDDPSDGLQKDARWALGQVTGKSYTDNEGWREWWNNFGSQDERFK